MVPMWGNFGEGFQYEPAVVHLWMRQGDPTTGHTAVEPRLHLVPDGVAVRLPDRASTHIDDVHIKRARRVQASLAPSGLPLYPPCETQKFCRRHMELTGNNRVCIHRLAADGAKRLRFVESRHQGQIHLPGRLQE
jgi:hypothetical protein